MMNKHTMCLLRSNDAYMRPNNIPTLVQIMACRLFGAKPLSEPMQAYCQVEPKEHISVKYYSKFKGFHSRKCTQKCRLRNGGHFVSGLNVLSFLFQRLCCCMWQELCSCLAFGFVLLWLGTQKIKSSNGRLWGCQTGAKSEHPKVVQNSSFEWVVEWLL